VVGPKSNKEAIFMIGRRATVGLSLLCALLFSAIAVQSAAATAGTNITAFACEKVAAGATGEFNDAHCDSKIVTKDGYNHKLITGKTEFEVTNETTGGAKSTAVFEGTPFKVQTKIECTTLTGEGTIENSEPSAGVHKLTGNGVLRYTECTVVKPTPCTLNEVVVSIGSVETQEGLTDPLNNSNGMGIELKPGAGLFASIILQNVSCPLFNKTFPVEGSVIVTNGPGTAEPQNRPWSGATAVVTPAMSNLTAATRPATYSGIATVKMKGGNSAAITTTTVT
jgi:hypothetical protein